jgi:hypothetical protein
MCLLFSFGAALFAQEHPRKAPATYAGSGVKQLEPQSLPPSRSHTLARPATLGLGALSAEERSRLGAVGPKRRIGVHRELPESALERGTWATLPDGRSIWRLAIRSDAAAGLRVHFSGFSVGGGKLWVHSSNSVDGPYTGDGPYGNGDFWTSTVEGDSVVIEYEAASPAAVEAPLPFRIRTVAHQAIRIGYEPDTSPALMLAPFAASSNEIATAPDYAASCNLDVKCYPEWQDTKRSVAHIQFEETQGPEQGTFLCSGSLVATRDNSFKPYLLTAGHCIHDEAAARSLETFWQYESNGCNLGPPANRGTLNSANGGHLLSWSDLINGDFSLVLLPNVPSGVVFAGWDTVDPTVGSPVVGIHHPAGSYKRISFGATTPSFDVSVGGDAAPAAMYTTVNYSQGITQPGSSGSPLFSGPGVVVGMLTYGPAAPGDVLCAGGDFGGYGKFSNAYVYLRDYLEDLPFSIVAPSANTLKFTGRNHTMTGNTSQTVTLTVQAAAPVAFKLQPDSPWVQLSADTGTVSKTSPFKVQVSIDPKYLIASDTYTTTIGILSGAAPPQYINIDATMKIDTSNVTASAIPNPVHESGNNWTLKLHLQESAGTATTLTHLKIDGVDYTGKITKWFGTDHIDASAAIDGVISTTGLVTPVDKYFEFFGQDIASGERWYRMLVVTFQ